MRLPWRREPRPISCAEVKAVLQAYLDDETDELATRRVALHLEDCGRCGMEVVIHRHNKESLSRRGPDLDPASVARLRAFGARLAAGDIADPGKRPGVVAMGPRVRLRLVVVLGVVARRSSPPAAAPRERRRSDRSARCRTAR